MITTGSDNQPHISVVIPIYNEQEVLPELYRRLRLALEKIGKDYEIIFVDDGSSDSSYPILRSMQEGNKQVRVLRFSRNFGHHIAITAGLDHARGQYVVLMDGDLQDQPEYLEVLLVEINKGYDLVYAMRENRQDKVLKRLTSAMFWKVIRRLSGMNIPLNQSMMRIMTQRYAEAIKSMREQSRFLAGMMAWVGFRQTGIPIPHGERFAGRSKYNLFKLMKLTFHATCSFSNIPLQLASISGFVISSVAFAYGVVLIVEKLIYGLQPGFASLMVAILFMGGVQLITIGILGEYIGRILGETQRRPLYCIEADLNSIGAPLQPEVRNALPIGSNLA